MNHPRNLVLRAGLMSAALATALVVGGGPATAEEAAPMQLAQDHDDGHTDHGDGTTHGGPQWRGGGVGGSHGHGGGHSGGTGHSDRGGRPEWAGRGGDHTVDDVVFHYRPGHDDRGDIHDHDEGGEPGSGGHMEDDESHSHDS